MCKQNNIENIDSIICALQQKFPGRKITYNPVICTNREINMMNGQCIYYGIITYGFADNPIEVYDINDDLFIEVQPNSQIIELFCFILRWNNSEEGYDPAISRYANFRGYEIRVEGHSFLDFNLLESYP